MGDSSSVPDVEITRDGPVSVPLDYNVPNGGELQPVNVGATIDGSGAGAAFYAVLQVLDPNGRSMGKYITSSIAAGASADVTWFPGLIAPASSSGGGSGPALLFSTTLTSTQANISTGALPQTHSDLLIYTLLRTNEAISGNAQGAIQFNSDFTAANYRTVWLRNLGTTVSGGNSTTSSGINCVPVAGAQADAGAFAIGRIEIPNYTAAGQKFAWAGLGLMLTIGTTGNNSVWAVQGKWLTGGAITGINFLPNAGGGGQFVSGCRVAVYGLG